MPNPQTITKAKNHTATPLISIGLPVYNGERYLSRSLDSLLGQSFQDFEIIVVDNASTDRTEAIVREYMQREPRIRYYKNERNRGAVYNFNRALALARGEYFKWMAADDVIRPEFLHACLQVLQANPQAALVYAKAAFIDDQGRVIYRFDDIMELPPWPRQTLPRTRQFLEAVFRDGSAANVIIFGLAPTRVLRAIRPLGNYFGCDYVAVTELALQGEIHEIPQVLAFYRRHSGSSSTYRKSPSASEQQAFYDPSITSRIRQEFNLRRRYLEVCLVVARAQLHPLAKTRLLAAIANIVARRAVWRVGFEIRAALGKLDTSPPIKRTEGIGLHWSEFS